MNFLAHIYLSGSNDLIKIGNFMADGIRGKQFESYPAEVKKGILLHREIDSFTDAHPVFRLSTKKLHSRYHHYAGVIVDMLYDHFLAKNWANYSDEDLEIFINNFYFSLEKNKDILSQRTLEIMPYMFKQNWLLSYKTIDGIAGILKQMDYRTKNASKMQFAVEELVEYYDEFEAEFTLFIEDIRAHCKERLIIL